MTLDRRSAFLALGASAMLRPFSLRSANVDEASFRLAIAELAYRGGGSLILPVAQLILRAALWLPANITLDLGGGELLFDLGEPLDRGLCLSNNCHVRNGRIRVKSRGKPSAQGQIHAPISIGHGYEDAIAKSGDPISRWSVDQLVLTSDKWTERDDGAWVGSPGIQIVGGVDHGMIRNVTVPDNDRMLGAIFLDWGRSGSLAADESRANQENNMRLYNKGAYTTHPRSIEISGVTVGHLTAPATALPDTGSFGIRLSGVGDIIVRNVKIASITRAAILHSVGDLGSEYARPIDRVRLARGILIDNISCGDCTTGNLIDSDGRADNIARARSDGFRPIQAINAKTDIIVSHARGQSSHSKPSAGVVVRNQSGGTFSDISVEGFSEGFRIDEAVTDVSLIRPVAQGCRSRGIAIGHWQYPPRDIRVIDPRCSDNGSGRDPGNVGILIEKSQNVTVSGGVLGVAGRYDNAQRIGVQVADGAVGTTLTDIHIASSRAGDGIGVAVLFGEAYNIVTLVSGNSSDRLFVVSPRAGLELLPIAHAGKSTVYTSPPVQERDLAGLTVQEGDTIRFEHPRADGVRGLRALSSGRLGPHTKLLFGIDESTAAGIASSGVMSGIQANS